MIEASRHEASIREKYQNQLEEVEQKIKNAEDRLEREKQKIDRSHDAALREESLLIKSRKLDFEESEKDKEALAAVERMEDPDVTKTELSSLNRKMTEIHESSASLREQREALRSTEHAQVESEEDVCLKVRETKLCRRMHSNLNYLSPGRWQAMRRCRRRRPRATPGITNDRNGFYAFLGKHSIR